MSRRSRYHKVEDDDNFETEVFASFNKKPAKDDDDSGSDENKNDSDEEPADEDILDEGESTDDSDAPEVVSLVHSRDKAISTLREVMQLVKDQRTHEKQKRREHTHMFEEQKKRKLEQLEQAKLPEDFLEEIDAKIPKKKKSEKMTKSVEKDGLKEAENSDSAEGDEPEVKPADDTDIVDRDFIPLEQKSLDRVGLVAVSLKEKDEHLKTLPAKAADYRHKLLYGHRIQRETSKEHRAKKLKRQARFS
ncbi:hypothetical protein ACJMK2_007142 [Sinanodonta woodiana]|uniref:Uncharacterized protein n=1 Tax=Sinanodonta woodiana TaxID=1069815 RepID=A0ABD3VKR5_SINWO